MGRNYVPVAVSMMRLRRKLTMEQAREVKERLDEGETLSSIARAFNVMPCLIYRIREGLTYVDA